VFFVLPIVVILATRNLDTSFYDDVVPEESLEVAPELVDPGPEEEL
jgi:hypothetical protein